MYSSIIRNNSCSSGCIRVDAVDIEAIKNGVHQLIDVRSEEEYSKGHLLNAMHIDLQELRLHLDELKGLKTMLVAYSKDGKRSELVATILKAKGIPCLNGGSITELNDKLTQNNMEKANVL